MVLKPLGEITWLASLTVYSCRNWAWLWPAPVSTMVSAGTASWTMSSTALMRSGSVRSVRPGASFLFQGTTRSAILPSQ